MDLCEPPLDWHVFTIWAGCHVAERQRAAKGIRRGLELAG